MPRKRAQTSSLGGSINYVFLRKIPQGHVVSDKDIATRDPTILSHPPRDQMVLESTGEYDPLCRRIFNRSRPHITPPSLSGESAKLKCNKTNTTSIHHTHLLKHLITMMVNYFKKNLKSNLCKNNRYRNNKCLTYLIVNTWNLLLTWGQQPYPRLRISWEYLSHHPYRNSLS